MRYKSNNQTEHIITEKAKKKEIKAKERASFENPESQTFTLSIVRLRTKKICSNNSLLAEVLLPKVAPMGVIGVVAIGVPGLLQRSPQWRNEVSLLRIFSLFIFLSPLKSSLQLSNHYNAYNVFTRFLAKCAMFYLHTL